MIVARSVASPFLFLVFACFGCQSSRLSSGVSPEAIRRVRIGMTEAEVKGLLGRPAKIVEYHDGRDSWSVWNYAEEVQGAWGYPMLSVRFDNGDVNEVSATKEVWWGADQDSLYFRSRSYRDGGAWESPKFVSAFR